MVLDLTSRTRRTIDHDEVLVYLEQAQTDAADMLLARLEQDPDASVRVAEYISYRFTEAQRLEDKMLRTEEQSIGDLVPLSDVEVQRYGTRSQDHHQSSKVMVATVEALTRLTCERAGVSFNASPQSRAALIAEGHIWVSPRRLDGALPGLLNPIALWEIKEYWGKTRGGSKMSDAIYECQLVGQELRAFEDLHGVHVQHYVILDGREQWSARRSDLRRAIDLLEMGLIDELIVGREVLTEWPRIVKKLCVTAQGR
jgi:hypothetical protein